MTIKQLADEVEVVGEASVDSRERVTLARALKLLREQFGDKAGRFQVLYSHSTGLIALAPVVTVPLREQWIHENHTALKMLDAGIAAAGRGGLVERPSFAKYADDEIE
jgi:hypothetical protein